MAATWRKKPRAASRNQIEDGQGRREVRGMIVRGIILKTPFLIPLTTIPLTAAVSRFSGE